MSLRPRTWISEKLSTKNLMDTFFAYNLSVDCWLKVQLWMFSSASRPQAPNSSLVIWKTEHKGPLAVLFPFMSSQHVPERPDYEPQILFVFFSMLQTGCCPVQTLSSFRASLSLLPYDGKSHHFITSLVCVINFCPPWNILIVVQDNPEFIIYLSQLPNCWDYMHVPKRKLLEKQH